MSKKFDAVEMKHEIQEKIYKQLKPKSSDDYFKKLIEYSKKTRFAQLLSRHSDN